MAPEHHERRSSPSDLFALKFLDRHCVQGSDPTDPMLAERYDFLSDKARRWVVYDLQAQGLTDALQRKGHFVDRLRLERFARKEGAYWHCQPDAIEVHVKSVNIPKVRQQSSSEKRARNRQPRGRGTDKAATN
jgi:hypothetical protein